MAWVTPSTQSSGHVVTAVEWNELVNDILETVVAKITTKGDLGVGTGANALARLAVSANNGAFLVAASGETTGLKWLTPQTARLDLVSNQNINDNALTAIAFDGTTETIDLSNLHDGTTQNTRITMAVGGKYLVGGEAQFQSHAGGTYRIVALYKNGNQIAKEEALHAAAGPTPSYNLSTMHTFGIGDYVELKVKHDAGTGINVQNATLWVALQSTY